MQKPTRAEKHASALGCLICLVVIQCAAQKPIPASPEVTAAAVPIYPRLAAMAHIEGTVHLQVRIAAGKVVSVTLQDGQPMLAKAAEDNVKTWQFRETDTVTFDTAFRYEILQTPPPTDCDGGEDHNSKITLHFPASVEVSTPTMWVCDQTTAGSAHRRP
jgi:hypothetical protein